MSVARVVYHIARADFLERARRYSFLMTLAATLFLAYQVNVGNVVMSLGQYRGIYNSAWLGILMAMSTTLFVSLVAFYIIKDTIERDRRTGVGQILAATPLSRPSYLLGKALSNFAVLAVLVAILMLAAIAMQAWKAEDPHVDYWMLLAPFLVITLPAFAFLAALAVFYECIPGLRSGFGNVFYFFFWTAMLGVGINSKTAYFDFLGAGLIERTLIPAAKAQLADYKGGFSLQAGPHSGQKFTTFVWGGIHWSPELVLPRMVLLVLAFGVVLLAACLFDRFDPSRGIFHRAGAAIGVAGKGWLRGGKSAEAEELTSIDLGEAKLSTPGAQQFHLAPLGAAAGHFRFGALVAAELRLMLKGRRWWWYAGAAGFLIGGAVNSAAEAHGKILAFAWFWPVLLWSAMGAREARHDTGALVFSSAHALGRQLSAVWVAGVIVAAGTGGGVAARLLMDRHWASLGAWTVGAMFIPALALALGVWSGSSKLFEGLYTVLWYIGPAQPTRELDFIGASPAAVASGIPLYYLAAAAALLAVAVVGRRRQIQH